MSWSHKSVLCLLAGASLCVTGCAGLDPFGVTARTPAEPSSRYWAPPEHPPVVAPPRVVPDFDEGPLALADCLLIALANSPRMRLSWERTQATAAIVGQARGLYLPQADFTASGQRQKFLAQTDVGQESKYRRTRRTVSFGVRQLLLDGGARRAQVGAAEAALRAADFRHNAALLDLALETQVGYYRLLAFRSLLNVAEDTVRQRTRHLELAEVRQRAGRGRLLEVLQARAEKADAEFAVVDARQQVRDARARLAYVMGLPVSSPLEIVDIPEEVHALEQQDVDRLLKGAATNRAQLQAAIAEVERARQALAVQRAARWPELNASGAFGWADWHSPPDEEDEWSLALNLSLPIFTGFQRSYRIRQAEAELRAAVNAYEGVLQDVELEVWVAYSGILRAEEAINAAESFLQSARESLKVSEREYQEGRATIVELIDAQTGLTRALTRKVAARLDWYVAISRLERAVGKSWRQGPRHARSEERPGESPSAQ